MRKLSRETDRQMRSVNCHVNWICDLHSALSKDNNRDNGKTRVLLVSLIMCCVSSITNSPFPLPSFYLWSIRLWCLNLNVGTYMQYSSEVLFQQSPLLYFHENSPLGWDMSLISGKVGASLLRSFRNMDLLQCNVLLIMYHIRISIANS